MTNRNINSLISLWNRRLNSGTQSEEYKCALSECIYDLQSLEIKDIDSSFDEIHDWLNDLEADKMAHTA